MYVCTYVCMYVCMYILMYVCIYTYTYIYVCIYWYMYACMYIYIYIYIYVCMYLWIYIYAHAKIKNFHSYFFNLFTGHNTKHDQEIEAKNKPIIYDLNMGVFRFSLDVMHIGQFIPNFSLLECTNVAITVDATKVFFMYICVCIHICLYVYASIMFSRIKWMFIYVHYLFITWVHKCSHNRRCNQGIFYVHMCIYIYMFVYIYMHP
jgi:hypothetical protein